MFFDIDLKRKLSDIATSLPLPEGVVIEGIFLAGSVAKHTATAKSDLDLYAVTKSPKMWRKFYRAFDVDVDLFVLSERTIRAAIVAKKPVLLTSIAEAEIVQDSNGLLRSLKDASIARVAEGPLRLSEFDAKSIAHRFSTILDDCEECFELDPPTSIMMMLGCLKQLSELYLNANGFWDASPRRTFRVVAGLNPDHARLFEQVAGELISAGDRLAAFRQIVDLALAPYGGLQRYFESPVLRAPAALKGSDQS